MWGLWIKNYESLGQWSPNLHNDGMIGHRKFLRVTDS